jgi:hypothetical protein
MTLGCIDKPGSYLNDSIVANESVAPHSSDLVSSYYLYLWIGWLTAHSQANADRLWTLTEKIIGETFTF